MGRRVIPECPYFTFEEFAVSAQHPELVDPVPWLYEAHVIQLVRDVLWPLREALGFKFHVLSGYRNSALNKAVGGSPTSQHRVAQAADIRCVDWHLLYLTAMRMAGEPKIRPGQVIGYPSRHFVHFATPSATFPKASFHIHDPAKGHEYVHVLSEDQVAAVLA